MTDPFKVRHLPLADNILVLDKDGKVVEQGTFEYLRSRDGFVSKLMLHPELLESKSRSGDAEDASQKVPAAAVAKVLRGPSANDAADLARQTGDISVYKYYLKSIGWKIGLANGIGSLVFMLGTKTPR
jgi:ATP-binding cassette subfamily C (CFTR/MRP) protein 1